MKIAKRGFPAFLQLGASIMLPIICFGASPARAQFSQQQTQNRETQQALPVSVTIGGSFPVNGSFVAYPSERVDQFITRIYSLAKEQQMMRQERMPAAQSQLQISEEPTPLAAQKAAQQAKLEARFEYPLRNIILRRKTGTTEIVDLQKFRLTGDYACNPYVRNDDVVIFPEVDKDREFVSISGAVNNSTRFQFVEGDRLSDAVLFAGGLNSAYDSLTVAVISRLDKSGEKEHQITVGLPENPPLKRGDRIVIPADENERRDFRVQVSGEVFHPGSVPITKDSTTIREVIRKVGGFKPDADLRNAELIRGGKTYPSLFHNENLETLLMMRSANLYTSDTLGLAVDERLRYLRANGAIDFERIDSTSEGDFIVRDGDVIMVPAQQNVVYVYGQVKSPGYIPCVVGQKVAYYVKKAGGIGEAARGDVFLIKAGTRTWETVGDPDNTAIMPGDMLYVPKEPRRELDFYLIRIGAVAQILGGIATVILLFKQF